MVGRLGAVVMAAVGVAVAVGAVPASAAAPGPVYSGGVADPGVVRTGGHFSAFATGSRAPMFEGDEAGGPWTALGPALASVPGWATTGVVWAPDVVRTSAGWVMYCALPAVGTNGQRCIGTATAPAATGPYTPAATAAELRHRGEPGGVCDGDSPCTGSGATPSPGALL